MGVRWNSRVIRRGLWPMSASDAARRVRADAVRTFDARHDACNVGTGTTEHLMALTGRELRSTASEDGTLSLTLADITLDDPAADEVIVRVEAAPINPSDLGLLLGPADIASLQ